MRKKIIQRTLVVIVSCMLLGLYVSDFASISDKETAAKFSVDIMPPTTTATMENSFENAEPIADIGCIMTIDDLI